MAKSNICGDCHHFSDVGRCRIGSFSKRDLVAFFADACPYFTREPEQPAPEPKKEMEKETPTTKVCKKCGRELPLEQFHKNRWGYTQVCKECKAGKTSDKGPLQEYKLRKADPKPEKPKRAPLTPEEVKAHKQNAIQLALTFATDQELAYELTRRGYKGRLTKTIINEE